ncbi:MAG: DUF3488 and DUF4129 domain-containing transglutaminase family protein [Blastocatellia bacterium]
MTLDRYFKLSSYGMLSVSYLMLAFNRQVDLVTLLLYAIVLAAAWRLDTGRMSWHISRRVANWLVFPYLPFLLVDWRVLGTAPVVVVVHFLFYTSAFKLLHPKENRDWLWLYVIAFFEVLLAAGMTIDAIFLALLAVFLFFALSTLMSFEIHRAGLETARADSRLDVWLDAPPGQQTAPRGKWRSLGYFSALALTAILLLAAPLFVAMPRMQRGFMGNKLLGGSTLSGFSEKVELGDVAQIKLNPQVVMRVQVESAPGQFLMPLKWRGVTLDHYDGKSWNNSRPGRMAVPLMDDGFHTGEMAGKQSLTRQKFFLAPVDTGALFVTAHPLRVSSPMLRGLLRDFSDGLWVREQRAGHLVYNVISDTTVYAETELQADNSRAWPEEIQERYLQLPGAIDPRIGQHAIELAKGLRTQHEIARRIESWLQTSLQYSLSLRRMNQADPIADFLFNVRSGHCEYFATAMALLLRSQGIPTRLVNGFQTGEYSEIANIYTVRQADAHSWVEVYYPAHGWVAFDPTPSAGLNQYDAGMLATLRHYGEALEMFWLEKVIGFDTQAQISMTAGLQQFISRWQDKAGMRWLDWKDRFTNWLRERRAGKGDILPGFSAFAWPESPAALLRHPLALACYTVVALAGTGWYWRRRQRTWRRAAADTTESAIAFYQEMLDLLARAGHARAPHQTPREFASLMDSPAINEITQLYQRTRFGGALLEQTDINRVSALLGALRAELQNR